MKASLEMGSPWKDKINITPLEKVVIQILFQEKEIDEYIEAVCSH